MRELRQSTAVTVKLGPMLDTAGDPVTGLTITKADLRLSKNGGNMAAASADQGASDAGAPHDELGAYDCSFNTTDTNTLGHIRAIALEAGAIVGWEDFNVLTANDWDAKYDTGVKNANTTQFAGQTVTAAAGVTLPASVASPTNITAGTITTVTTLTNAPADSAGVTTLLTRIPSGIFTGITRLSHWLGAIMGKQAADATALTEIRASGAGSGTYDPPSDSLEALKDDQMTATELENAVLDAVLADHLDSGSVGAGINAASSAGDPWATAIPGAYGSGTAGKIVGDNINATISSRATPAQVAAELGTYDGPTNAEMVARTLAAASYALDSTVAKDATVAKEATLADVPTNAELAARTLVAADYATAAEQATSGGKLDDIYGKVDSEIQAIIDALAILQTAMDALPSDSDVKAQVVAALITDTYADPSALAGALGGSLSIKDKLGWVSAAILRAGSFNKDTGVQLIKNSSGTDIAKATAADDGTTTTRGAFGAP